MTATDSPSTKVHGGLATHTPPSSLAPGGHAVHAPAPPPEHLVQLASHVRQSRPSLHEPESHTATHEPPRRIGRPPATGQAVQLDALAGDVHVEQPASHGAHAPATSGAIPAGHAATQPPAHAYGVAPFASHAVHAAGPAPSHSAHEPSHASHAPSVLRNSAEGHAFRHAPPRSAG